MDKQSGHLSDVQVEQYGNTVTPQQPEADDRDHQIETHLADCGGCLERVFAAQRKRLALSPNPNMKTGHNPRRHNAGSANPGPLGRDCPDEDDLRHLAAGLCSEDVGIKLTQHAAQCDHCGPLLRAYIEDFSEDLSDEDQVVLARLKSSSAGGQRKLVEAMLAASGKSSAKPSTIKPSKKAFPWRWVLAPAALAACGAITFAIWYEQRETPEKVEKLLVQAYTENRTMEMRLSGAAWGQMRVTLGPNDSVFSKPSPLFKAEEIIAHRQPAEPKSVDWLKVKAESELIEQQPSAAISTLNAALDIRPDSAPLMLDLAIAYVQRAPGSGDARDYPKAIDLLSKITQRDPHNQEAVFNLALVYSRLEMWDLAARTWESYLQLDSNGPWAQEAKQKLDLARSKLKLSLQPQPEESLTSAEFLKLSDGALDLHVEQYQDISLRRWIVPAIADPQSAERRAISRLADIMRQKHSDSWLQDFLGPPRGRDSSGAAHLSAAVSANLKGHYAEALQESQRAEEFFHHQHSRPGELRARYESVYAHQRFVHGRECLSRSYPLEKSLAGSGYHWLQSQVAIERAMCLNFTGQLKAIGPALSSSLETANRFQLTILALRSLGISQGLENQQGKYEAAWESGLQGLHKYWTSQPSAQRVFQFYAGLARSAEHMELWSTAELLQSHAVNILDGEADRIQRGAAKIELAKILVAENRDAEAAKELASANELLDREVTEPTSREYRLAGKIGLAELQLRHGDASEALSTLKPAEELLSESDGYFVSLNYYRLFGSINFQLRNLNQASAAYESAIVIAERSLRTIQEPHDRLKWIQEVEEAYRGLVRVLIEQHKESNALNLWEWYKNRPSDDTLRPLREAETVDWLEIGKTAPPVSWRSDNSARIIYAVFDDGFQIWVTTNGKLTTVWVATKSGYLTEMAERFREICARPDSSLDEANRLGERLFGLLLQPAMSELPPGWKVAIELDRALAGLPLEALRSPDGWYFGERNPTVYSPGMIREKQLRKTEPFKRGSTLLLADASADPNYDYLPGSEVEREVVTRVFPRTKVLSSNEMSVSTIRRLLGKTDIFAFVGHAERNESSTSLRLSRTVTINGNDFPPEALQRLKLAVLAACSTASERQDGLLETRNLVHSFLAGGVTSVLASSWNVDSQTTTALMITFYTRLAAGDSASNALFIARTEILKTHKHPFFWSGFVLFGRG